MAPDEIAGQIRLLVAQQRYAEVAPLLHDYAAAIIARCVHAEDEKEFQEARQFLRLTMNLVKAQRAHDAVRLTTLEREHRYYASAQTRKPNLDITG